VRSIAHTAHCQWLSRHIVDTSVWWHYMLCSPLGITLVTGTVVLLQRLKTLPSQRLRSPSDTAFHFTLSRRLSVCLPHFPPPRLLFNNINRTRESGSTQRWVHTHVYTFFVNNEWVLALSVSVVSLGVGEIELKIDWQACKQVLNCQILHLVCQWD